MTKPCDPTAHSCEGLQEFYDKFHKHLEEEAEEKAQHTKLYNAVFQREDLETNTPPGLLQLCSRISADLHTMKVANDRQKTFIGGVVFAVSGIWAFAGGVGHKILEIWSKL